MSCKPTRTRALVYRMPSLTVDLRSSPCCESPSIMFRAAMRQAKPALTQPRSVKTLGKVEES